MRVVVCGGRNFANGAGLRAVLDLARITELAAGDATGADSFALTWAKEHWIPHRKFVADWKAHGRKAGPLRNRQMLDEFKPDAVIAFDGGAGTADCIRAATERGIKIHDFRGINA